MSSFVVKENMKPGDHCLQLQPFFVGWWKDCRCRNMLWLYNIGNMLKKYTSTDPQCRKVIVAYEYLAHKFVI